MALVLCLALASWSHAAASPDLTPPWPDADALAPIDGTRVTFPSHSPFTLSDAGSRGRDNPSTTAVARLFLPETASPQAPVPAVVMLHGASGVLHVRELTYARQLAAMGVAALVVDGFAARRGRANGFVDRLMKITETMLAADAYAGLDYLAGRPEVDADRVALIGFSYGGMVATYAAYAQVAERFATDGRRFAGHVTFYAPCIATFEDNRATGAPVLMLFGSEDAIVDRERCAAVAAELEAGGASVDMVVYEGAYHQWDGHFSHPREIGRNLAGCRLVVERDGTVRDARWFLPMRGTLTRRIILGLCADDEGYLIGRDERVRERSNRDLARFLHRVLAADRP